MKIASVESLHADAGQRNFDFLKITTDDGLVGWSEYNESFGGPGVSVVIERLAPTIVGKDPRAYESLVALMYAVRRQASGGIAQQAIGAIENALLDIKAKALGVPVYELLGGPIRDRIRLYWSHCGTYRLAWSKEMQLPPLRTLDDVVKAGREVVGARLHRAEDQRLRPRGETPSAFPGLRAPGMLPGAQRRAGRPQGHARGAGRLPGRSGTRHGHPG